MKTKKLITLALSVAMISAAFVTVSAATLTEEQQDGKTEVTARINGGVPDGITYEIIIPDVIDFGDLTQPDSNTDSYKIVDYSVTLEKVNGLDENTQQISVYVKDQNATPDGNQDFKIANKENSAITFKYDVYDTLVSEQDLPTFHSLNYNTMTKTKGFYLTGFTFEGQELKGTLAINQSQLYGRDILDIAGDYSGYMVFYSTVEDIT